MPVVSSVRSMRRVVGSVSRVVGGLGSAGVGGAGLLVALGFVNEVLWPKGVVIGVEAAAEGVAMGVVMDALCGVVICGDVTLSAVLLDPWGSGTADGLADGLGYMSIMGDVDTDTNVRLSFVFCLVV